MKNDNVFYIMHWSSHENLRECLFRRIDVWFQQRLFDVYFQQKMCSSRLFLSYVLFTKVL